MSPVSQRFDDLEEAVDSMHALFKCWETGVMPASAARLSMLHRAKLVTHEWLANLIQHADFQDRTPTVCITLRPGHHQIECAIEDNSEGFSFPPLKDTPSVFAALPERGMGLQIIRASAEHVSYQQVCTHQYRLEFCVSAD